MRPPTDDCHFCDGWYHPSVKCNKYKTEKTRKMIAKKKKMCHLCFVKSSETHLPENKECPTDKNCYGWYSTTHHSVFCPARIEELKKANLFLPNINDDLMARFIETLEIDEKYLLATSSSLAQIIIPLKEITVIEELTAKYKRQNNFKSSNIVITLYFWLRENDEMQKFLKKEIICKARIVRTNEIKISCQDFLQLFSSITREISIEKLDSEVTFSDIIKKVPNIEIFEMYDNSLKVNGETWIKDLLEFKNGKNFRQLRIHLDTVEFDIEALKEFITTKCENNVVITIKYESSLPKDEINSFADKFGKIFFEEQYPSFRCKPHIQLESKGDRYCRYFTLDIEQPIPSASKTTRKRKLGK